MVDVFGTLGPACESEEILEQMFANGMTGMRINLVNREVQYAVLRVVIGQNNLVHRPLRKGFVEVLGGGEMIGVKVTLANRKQVDGRECADCDGGYPGAAFGAICPQQERGGAGNKHQRCKRILAKEHYSVDHKGTHKHVLHAGVRGCGEASEEPGHQPGQQAGQDQ